MLGPRKLGDARSSAVNLYRSGGPPFTEVELTSVTKTVSVIPYLFASVRNEIDLRVLRTVENKLRAEANQPLDEMLEEVREAINAEEAAVYLEDAVDEPGVYRKRAVIWSWDWPPDQFYLANEETLTGWVIRNDKKVVLLDFAYFDEESRARGYRNLRFRNRERQVDAVRARSEAKPLPPLSYVCIPVKRLGITIGALRFCVNGAGARFFDSRHVEILEMVADRIGEWWGSRIDKKADQAQRRRFAQVINNADHLNVRAFRELERREGPSFKNQLDAALEMLADASNLREALSVRLIDRSSNELYLAARLGLKWSEGGVRRVAGAGGVPNTTLTTDCLLAGHRREARGDRRAAWRGRTLDRGHFPGSHVPLARPHHGRRRTCRSRGHSRLR